MPLDGGLQSRAAPGSRVSTRKTALSHWCHGCGKKVEKPPPQRWHQCECGVGPVLRDLSSAFLAASLDPADPLPSRAAIPGVWEGCGGAPGGSPPRSAHERTTQRAKAAGSFRRVICAVKKAMRKSLSRAKGWCQANIRKARLHVPARQIRYSEDGLPPLECSRSSRVILKRV